MRSYVRVLALMTAASLTLGTYPAMAGSRDKPAAQMKSGRMAAVTISDQDFVGKVQSGTQFEISAAKIALDKSQDKDVRQFAQRMVHDHTMVADDLTKVLASDKDTALPKETAMDSDMQNKLQQLQAATGMDFDKSYVSMMVEDHQEDVKLFKDFQKSTHDPKLKGFAERTVAMIEAHLKAIERIQKNEKSS